MDQSSFLEVLSETIFHLEKMAVKAKEQQIINGYIFEELLRLVNEIKLLAQAKKNIPFELVNRWNTLYGIIFRAFEGSNVKSSLDKITQVINL